VVVVREAGRLSAADATRLLAVVTDPLPTSFLVLVAGSGTVPQALSKAVAAQGEVVECSMRTTGDRKGWLADRLHEAPVRFDTPAANLLRTHLGDDLGRLESVLGTLVAAYGPGASIDRHRLEPFLGLAGSVPPWELTGAIDEGDTAAALDALARMTGGGGMAGPAVVGVLHRHFANMLRLSGADVRNDDEAAALLGMRPGYPAKKALAQSRRLGGEPLAQAILLLAEADLQVKGRTALPTSLVLEVLVARLSRLVRGGAPARASARRR
jgi:DNA polymerase-3 subunit delta